MVNYKVVYWEFTSVATIFKGKTIVFINENLCEQEQLNEYNLLTKRSD